MARTTGPGVLARAQAAGLARRAYPVPVGLALARVRAERAWRDPAARQGARQHLELLVGATPRAGEVDQLARRYLYETLRYRELLGRTAVTTTVPVDGLERLRAQQRAGRGVVLSVVHQGQFGAHPAAIARHGVPMSVLLGPALFGPQPATSAGLLRRQLLAAFRAGRDVTLLNARNSYDTARAVLREGGVVWLGCDLTGTTPVRFLGRTYYVPSGTARLAMDTGAPVLPVSAFRYGRLERLEVQEALRPQDHADHRALLQAVFDRHAPAVLAWPEAVERPREHFRTEPAAR